MPRNMSCAFTADQVLDGSKTVSRRDGWLFLNLGDPLNLVRKAMGLKRGEKVEVLRRVKVVSLRRERLALLWEDPEYGRQEMVREGFPGLDPRTFVQRYFVPYGLFGNSIVTRIEWEYIDRAEQGGE